MSAWRTTTYPGRSQEREGLKDVVTLDQAQDHWNTFDLSESVMRKNEVLSNGGRPEV